MKYKPSQVMDVFVEVSRDEDAFVISAYLVHDGFDHQDRAGLFALHFGRINLTLTIHECSLPTPPCMPELEARRSSVMAADTTAPVWVRRRLDGGAAAPASDATPMEGGTTSSIAHSAEVVGLQGRSALRYVAVDCRSLSSLWHGQTRRLDCRMCWKTNWKMNNRKDFAICVLAS